MTCREALAASGCMMAAYFWGNSAEGAKKACRELYNSYFGSSQSVSSRIKGKLLLEGPFCCHCANEQKMAVRAYFIKKHGEMLGLLDMVEKARTEEEIYVLGQEMQAIGCAIKAAKAIQTRDAEMLPFLQAAEIGLQAGAGWADTFCNDIAPYGSRILVKTGTPEDSGLPVALVLRGGEEFLIGSLSIPTKSVGAGEILEKRVCEGGILKDGSGLLGFPTLPLAISYSDGGDVVGLGRLEMKATLNSMHIENPEQFLYGLFYEAEKDFSKAHSHAERFIRSNAQTKQEADRIISSPFYSFCLRTPGDKDAQKLHLDASVIYTVGDYFGYSITVSMPGSRLYGAYMLPDSRETVRFALSACDCKSR